MLKVKMLRHSRPLRSFAMLSTCLMIGIILQSCTPQNAGQPPVVSATVPAATPTPAPTVTPESKKPDTPPVEALAATRPIEAKPEPKPEPLVVPPQPEPVVEIQAPASVALLVPLSGRAAAIGGALRNAAEMALFDLADEKFILTVHDTGSTTDGAISAATEALDGGAKLIIGPLFRDAATAIRPIAAQAQVPVLTFSNDAKVAGDGVWTFGLLPGQQVDRVVRFASERALLRFASFYPDSEYGQSTATALQVSATELGGQVTRLQSYRMDDDLQELVKDFADYNLRKLTLQNQRNELSQQGGAFAQRALNKLKGRETAGPFAYDAVLLPEGGTAVRNLAPMMAYYDIDPREVRYLGTALWLDPTLGREPTLVGGWFAAPDPAAGQDFRVRYQEIYGSAPPTLASLGYDAMALAAVLARQETDEPYSADWLTQTSGFAGTDGLFRLLPDGRNERGLAVIELTEQGYKIVDPGPTSFPTPPEQPALTN